MNEFTIEKCLNLLKRLFNKLRHFPMEFVKASFY